MAIKRLPTVHSRFGIKPEPLATQAICEGVVAGMLADHFLGRSEAAYEAALRPSVLAVAHKRGFAAFLEFSLEKETPGRGARKKIDAVLVYGRQVIAFEIKTIRRNAIGFTLAEDLSKLTSFVQDAATDEEIRRISTWQLIAWDSHAFDHNDVRSSDALRAGVALIEKQLVKAKLSKGNWDVSNLLRPTSRTPSSGQVILAEGYVGNRRAWCLAVCVRSPSE
jgi:Holliday junction resolvase